MDTIRYGIIGCGSMGREHIENLKALGGADVTALADPDAGSREAGARALLDGQAQVFDDHRRPARQRPVRRARDRHARTSRTSR